MEKKKDLVKGLLSLCCCLLDSSLKIKYLALDGTSWEYGEKKIHLLTLSVVYNGVSIPIWWEELDKKGTSNFKEQKRVFREAGKFLNLEGLVLLADREYIGRSWFKYLTNRKIGFVIRLKKSVYKEEIDAMGTIRSDSGMMRKARYIKLERMAKFHRYSKYGVSKRIRISGYGFTFVVLKNPKPTADEKLLYFISSMKDKKKISKAYRIRWTIEICFRHLKSNGFRLEELGMKDSDKIKLMMGIVVFLYVICITEGSRKLRKKKKSDWKTYADDSRFLAVSIFRKGYDYLAREFNDLLSFIKFLKKQLDGKNLLFLQNVQ